MLTFREWPIDQEDRDDPIGDFARDAARPLAGWMEILTHGAPLDHLDEFGASPLARKAAESAWVEYVRATRDRATKTAG